MPQIGRKISDRHASRQQRRSLLHSLSTIGLLAIVVVVLAACAGLNDSGTHDYYIATQAAQQAAGEDVEPGDEGDVPVDGEEPEDGEAEEPGEGSDAEEDLVAVGQELAVSSGCTGCHSIDGTAGVGPTWQGLFGAEIPLEDGSTVTADEDYIAESIVDPNAKIHEGFQPIMPATYSDWSDDQINAIIAYIQSLE